MFSLDTNVLRHGVMVAHDTLTVVVEVRILLSQQILTLKLTKITIVMSIELQRQYIEEIKKEIENLDRILNNDNDTVRDEILLNTYKALEIQ